MKIPLKLMQLFTFVICLSFISLSIANLTCMSVDYMVLKRKNFTCILSGKNVTCDFVINDTRTCEEDEICFTIVHKIDSKVILKFLDCFTYDKYVRLDHNECSLLHGVEELYSCQCNTTNCNLLLTYSGDEMLNRSNNGSSRRILEIEDNGLYIYILIFFLLLLCGSIFLGVCYFSNNTLNSQRKDVSKKEDHSEDKYPLTFIRLLNKSSERSLWLCTWNGNNVRAKIFDSSNIALWKNEVNVYKTMRSFENIYVSKFISSFSRNVNPNKGLVILTEFSEIGSIFDYLESNRLSLKDVLSLALDIAKGLQYLHSDIDELSSKPVIIHRDIKSKNVLLRNGLQGFLSDFGLALVLQKDSNVGEQPQVGTLRYMPPEVIEGIVSFSFEAFKSIDVYSLGIVYWELVSRCSQLEGTEVFVKPFETYTSQITMSIMYDLVVVKKLRPKFEDCWLQNPVIQQFAEVINECWDQEADFRPSPSWIIKRLEQLQNFYESSLLRS